MKQHFFIVYDFVQDKRRAKCVKILEKYGIRIQYSIFEFNLTKARKIELINLLTQKGFLEDRKGEAFMILPVSVDCAKKIQRFGNTVDIIGKSYLVSL